ncbi:MAG: hypothetical protein ACR2MU_05425, partial [Gaiellaceae bacterium]
MRATGGRVEHSDADFAEPDAPAAVVAAARASLGHLDILVVNHARSGSGTLAELTADELAGYAVSKGALHQATRTLSDVLIETGIT